MSKNMYIKSFIIVSGMAFTLLISSPAFATTLNGLEQSQNINKVGRFNRGAQRMISGVFGQVVSVTGNTITVNGKDGKIYSIDATNAKIFKSKDNSLVITDIKIGDTLIVKGKVSGTTVSATVIKDGLWSASEVRHGKLPGVYGTVSAVNGTTITLTREDGKTYTVDASKAVITNGVKAKKPAVITVSDIVIGDSVMVNGTVDGTNVKANKIFDGRFKVKILKK